MDESALRRCQVCSKNRWRRRAWPSQPPPPTATETLGRREVPCLPQSKQKLQTHKVIQNKVKQNKVKQGQTGQNSQNKLRIILRTSKEGSIQAKYSPTFDEFPRRTYPDFCFGWLWVSTPRTGLALAEVGASSLGKEILHMARWHSIAHGKLTLWHQGIYIY